MHQKGDEMSSATQHKDNSLILHFEDLSGPKLLIGDLEIAIIECSRRYVRLVGQERFKLTRHTLYTGQIRFDNGRVCEAEGAIAGHGENHSYFRFKKPLSNSLINRRSHFRLNFPDSEHISLTVGDCELKVSDLSEASLQFVRPVDKACTEGQDVVGTLTLHDSEKLAIAGKVIRVFPKKCILQLKSRIPYKVIMAEQAYLIRRQNSPESGPMKVLGR